MCPAGKYRLVLRLVPDLGLGVQPKVAGAAKCCTPVPKLGLWPSRPSPCWVTPRAPCALLAHCLPPRVPARCRQPVCIPGRQHAHSMTPGDHFPGRCILVRRMLRLIEHGMCRMHGNSPTLRRAHVITGFRARHGLPRKWVVSPREWVMDRALKHSPQLARRVRGSCVTSAFHWCAGGRQTPGGHPLSCEWDSGPV